MIYTASFGETWDCIAYKAWGDEMMFPQILEANRGMEHILVFNGGEKVKIPENIVLENKVISSPFQEGAAIEIIQAPW